MFIRLFGAPYEKLIVAIKAGNEAEAQKLVVAMSITDLSKVDNEGNAALIWAARKGLSSVCEALIPKMTDEAINAVVKDGSLKGHTALSIAKEKSFKNICDLLTQKSDKQNDPSTELNKQDEAQANLPASEENLYRVLQKMLEIQNW